MWLDVIIVLSLIGLCLACLKIWIHALRNGGQHTIDVNHYGEGWAEVVMFLILLSLGIYKFIRLIPHS